MMSVAARRWTLPLFSTTRGCKLFFSARSCDGIGTQTPFDLNLNENGSKLSIDDNKFDSSWLWVNCPVSITSSGQRLRNPAMYCGQKIRSYEVVTAAEVPENVASVPDHTCHPVNIYLDCEKSARDSQTIHREFLRITWDDDHSQDSHFSIRWLLSFSYDALGSSKRMHEVSPNDAIHSKFKLSRFVYEELFERDECKRFLLFKSLFNDGAVIIEDTPNVKAGFSPLEKIVERLCGPQSISHEKLYGKLWDVRQQTRPENIAYTSLSLEPHQDLAYFESMWLHCVTFDENIEGGESILIDCMSAAHALREISPHHFSTLTKTSATFVKQRNGVDMVYARPHIVLENVYNDSYAEIVQCNWSPPFEGPLQVHPNLVESYFEAYTAFSYMLNKRKLNNEIPPTRLTEDFKMYKEYAENYTWEHRLKPGEILVFNNRRLLHGRNSFHCTDGHECQRHLQGCYTNVDETLSQYRLMLRNFGRSDKKLLNVGNGSCWIC